MRNETIDDLIRSKGFGLEEAALAAGIGRSTIWRWSAGRSAPLRPQAEALADALGCSVDRVLRAAGNGGKKTPPGCPGRLRGS